MTTDFATYCSRLDEFLRRASSLSPSEQDPAFASLALDLFRLQYENVPIFRRLCDARGINPATVQRLVDIPCVPTTAFKEFDLTSLPPLERTRVFHSSGTTGHRPSRHFHGGDSLAIYEHSLLGPFRRHVLDGLREPVILLCLTPSPALAPHSSLVHMFETIGRQTGAGIAFLGRIESDGGWGLDLPAAHAAFTAAVSRGQPVVVLGTAFSFVQLIDHPAPGETSLRLPAGSRVMETGGYKGRTRELPKAELHRLITRQLGVPASHIVCEYGMSELSSQAYDRVAGHPLADGGRVFHFPPWARAVVVSPETGEEVRDGETGLIRAFDLANVRSVMAIQTEDLGVRRGDGFELLGRAPAAEPRGCSLMSTGGRP